MFREMWSLYYLLFYRSKTAQHRTSPHVSPGIGIDQYDPESSWS